MELWGNGMGVVCERGVQTAMAYVWEWCWGRICVCGVRMAMVWGMVPCRSLHFPKYMPLWQLFVRSAKGRKQIRIWFWVLRPTLFVKQ